MLSGVRLISSLLLVAALFQSSTASQGPSPPAGVLTQKDGLTLPILVTRVDPVYTRDAMRARIQGFVTLQIAIDTDGSVADVRVTRSLDSTYGLDAAAITAAKQWKFKPGLKDGKPVRVVMNLMLTFSISDLPPPMTLPAGFDPASKSDVGEWVRASVPTDGLLIEIAYPGGYSRVEAPGSVIRLVSQTSRLSVGVQQPMLLPAPIPFPMPVSLLGRFSETIRAQQSQSGSGLESLAAGQSALGSQNWLWLEMESSKLTLPSLPPELAAVIQDNIDGVHVWAFSTSVNSRLVQLMCILPMLKTTAEREAGLAAARSDCSEIIKRVSLTAR